MTWRSADAMHAPHALIHSQMARVNSLTLAAFQPFLNAMLQQKLSAMTPRLMVESTQLDGALSRAPQLHRPLSGDRVGT
jgi:hypothetical protein